jgi:phosphatidylglycerol:prolipoprotein diacylglycerol transferase
LYPTQLFEAGWLLIIFIMIHLIRNKKQYDGQLFLVYMILYAIGRFFIEFIRGDVERGFLFNGKVSHSQFIAIIIFVIVIVAHFYMKSRYAGQKGILTDNDRSRCDIDDQYERND